MLFNSVLFLFFFAAVYLIYWNLSGRSRQYFLIFASALFYAAWGLEREGWVGLRWTFHFLGIAVLNYYLIQLMLDRPAWKRPLIYLIVIIDLINLGIFKYTLFFRDVLIDFGLPVPESANEWSIFLPLAISFYTFQIIAYAIDVRRGVITERLGLRKFLLFIMFFPQLIAGPIMRSTDFLPQMDKPAIDRERMYTGLWFILGGLVKKVLIADTLGVILAPVFFDPDVHQGWVLYLAAVCFAFQIYCDFSGYTDIARGCAFLLGYEIPENFKAPLFAVSAQDLWQRWHITLATWLRDYIYISLGGSRVGAWRAYFNLFLTFTLGGLWHGADYTFLAWGALWGALLALERFFMVVYKMDFVPTNPVLRVLKILLVFGLFAGSAFMFRAQPVDHGDYQRSSAYIMGAMFTGVVANTEDAARDDYVEAGGDADLMEMTFGSDVFDLKTIPQTDQIIFITLLIFFFNLIQYRDGLLDRFRPYDPWLLLIIGAILGGLLMPALAVGSAQFIYFVF